MAETLTKAQQDALHAVEAGAVRRLKCGYAAWRTFGANPSVVGKLVKAGLVQMDPFVEAKAEITPAGREALAQSQG